MAVYQIAKIQVRRGRKGSETGIPRLASGEMAWAVDSRELYIGNGSAAEGSPAPAENTRILTQHDNIFDLFSYIYKNNTVQTGETLSAPVTQSVSAILDRSVWADGFGIYPDHVTGTSDEAVEMRSRAFQRALNKLFLYSDNNNSNTTPPENRVSLLFTAGNYTFNRKFYIPSYATIIGAGIDCTIFIQSSNDLAPLFSFITNDAVGFTDTAGLFSSNFEQIAHNGIFAATMVRINGITIKADCVFNSGTVSHSSFENIKSIPATTNSTNAVVQLGSSDYNVFDKWVIGSPGQAVSKGFEFSNSNNNVIRNSKFANVLGLGIVVTSGTNNVSSHNCFVDVNDGAGSPIELAAGNYSIGDIDNLARTITVNGTAAVKVLDLEPNKTAKYTVAYVYKESNSNTAVRSGELCVTTFSNGSVHLTDEYDATGNHEEDFEFVVAGSEVHLAPLLSINGKLARTIHYLLQPIDNN